MISNQENPVSAEKSGWTHFAAENEVNSGEPKISKIRGKEIGLFFVQGKYYAVLNHCPHEGAPMCAGKVGGLVTSEGPGRLGYDPERKILSCPWHHWEFDLETGLAVAAIRQKIKTYPVKTEGGSVWVKV